MQKVVVQYNNSTNEQVNFKLYIGIGKCFKKVHMQFCCYAL